MSQFLESSSTELEVEFPIEFQMHVRRVFADSMVLLSADMHFDVAAQTHGAVGRLELRRCYYELLDFDGPTKNSLLQVFSERIDGGRLISNWVIVLARLPAQFCDWWEGQLDMLREAGIHFTVHVILLTDALPCSWEALSRLRGSRLDAYRLEKFRVKTTCFDPVVQTQLSNATSRLCVQKQARALTFTTGGLIGNYVVDHSRWQRLLLPPFPAPARLLVDFEEHDASQVSPLVQVCAYRAGLEVP